MCRKVCYIDGGSLRRSIRNTRRECGIFLKTLQRSELVVVFVIDVAVSFGAYSLSRIHHQSFFALHDGPVLITHLGNCHQESCSEFRSPNCINFEVDPTSPANFHGFHQRKCQKHQKRILPNNAVHSNEKRLNHVGSKYFISMVTKTGKVRSSPIHPVPVPMRCLILIFILLFSSGTDEARPPMIGSEKVDLYGTWSGIAQNYHTIRILCEVWETYLFTISREAEY